MVSSCKKELPEWDKEADLVTDSSLFISGVEYISHTDFTCTFQVDIVRMNNLTSETSYSDIEIFGRDADGYIYSIDNITTFSPVPTPQFTSVFLFETDGYQLFAHGQASFFLSRYFEQVENKHPNQQIAFTTFRNEDGVTPTFHKESTSIFQNSAAYNDSLMNDIILKTDYQGYTSSNTTDFRDVMFEVMDTLEANIETTGVKSITLIDDIANNGPAFPDEAVLEEIIERAQLLDIRINVIHFHGYQYFRLATETGGFVIDDRQFYKVNQPYWDYDISAIGNNIASLDDILQSNYTTHRFEVICNNQGQFVWESGNFVRLDFQYGPNDIFELDAVIP